MISEFMAANEGGLRDGLERSADWLEIQNMGDMTIDLVGHSLTDEPNNLTKWVFPNALLQPGGFLIVFASGQTVDDPPDPTGQLHANLKLDRSGDFLALVSPDQVVLSQYGTAQQNYPRQLANVSYGAGLAADGTESEIGYMVKPTPGAPNVPNQQILSDYVRDTKFDVNRGFFDAPFQLTITTETADATIRYTIDGSAPSDSNGITYSGPLSVEKTTIVRAAAFKEDLVPTNVDTQTYLFLQDVLTQDGAGLPETWGRFVFGSTEAERGSPVPANYEVDPEVVNDPRYRDTFLDDLRTLPTVSLVVDPDDLWNEEDGIYSNPTREGRDWERPASIELIDLDGSTEFQIDAGVRIHGGFGRRPAATSKHSFRLFFRGIHGDTKLDYPWFGTDQVSSFDTIVLRANYNYSWARGNRGGSQTGKDYTMVTDRWGSVAQQEMGGLAPNGTFVHLYVNGLYWGVYNPNERPDASFQAEHRGGRKEEFDVLNHGGLVDGNRDSWRDLLSLVRQRPVDYAAVQESLDVDSFIDYMILNQFGGNGDWPQNNWYASRRRADGEKWQFHSWDTEFFFIDLRANRISSINDEGPGIIFLDLIRDEEFRVRFGDRIQRLFFNDGVLTAANNVRRLDELAAPLDRAAVGESARWGDAWMDQVSPPRTRDDDWLPRLEELRTEYFPARNEIVLAQYSRRRLFPDTAAPTFNQHGGDVASGFQLTMSSSEPTHAIYYTVDGSDPRLTGGEISGGAILYEGPIAIEETVSVQARVLNEDEWSPLVEATFTVAVPGDFNSDQVVTSDDVDLLCQQVRAQNNDLAFDLTGDGVVDLADHDVLITRILDTGPGDSNLDRVFNSADLVQIFQAGQYEDAIDGNSTWATGDWNCDGDLNTRDLVEAFQAGNYTAAVGALPALNSDVRSAVIDIQTVDIKPGAELSRSDSEDQLNADHPINPTRDRITLLGTGVVGPSSFFSSLKWQSSLDQLGQHPRGRFVIGLPRHPPIIVLGDSQ